MCIYMHTHIYIYDITRRCSFGLEINLRKELRFIVGVWPWCKKLVVGWQRDRVAGIYWNLLESMTVVFLRIY